jgi:two-component sensor histidine kinase
MQMTESSSTERYSSEARLLLREFSHRINNEFASAIGMISVVAGHLSNGEAKTALAAVEDQLHNYARVHHVLQMPEHNSRIDAAAYLRQLCRAAFRDNEGLIRVELLPSTSFIECRVTDNGASKPTIRPGNGTKIIESLAKSLDGTIDQQFGSEGATSVLIFPACR